MTREGLRLLHILESIERIRTYASTREAFFADPKTQDAVIRNLEIIGEAAKALGRETTASAPEIPWTDIAGLRDRLIHRYFSIDLELVWDVVSSELEPLERAVRVLLELPSSDV